ncbi:MAG: hypothetical protein IPP29_03180 [Bacteroidetes bacterium]|nr:hypothetical protein [Bacteroidota bacterium]
MNFNNSGTLSNCNGLPNYPDIYGWQFDALDAERFIILNLTDVSRNIDMSNNVITAIGQPQMLTYYPYNGSASGAIQGDALVSSIAPCFLTSELDPNVNISNFTIPPFGMVLITASKNAIIAKPTAAEICAGSQTTVMVYNWNFNPMLQNFHSTFGLLTPVANCPGLFNFDPNGNTGTAILTFECLFPNATTTTQITVQPRPTISISPLNGTYCPNNGLPITLTATTSLTNPIVLWGPNWGLNNPSGKVVTATPQFNTTYNAYIFDGVCFAESNDAVITVPRIEITNAGKKFVICNNENDPLNIEPQIDLSNCVGCTLSYLWSTSVATSSISVVPAAINTYTVTVTATNATCTSTVTATYTLALNECCGVAATNNVVLSPNVTLGVLLRVDETELSDAVTLICPTCVASTPTSVTINDNGPGLGTIYINGRFVVAAQDVIFNNCNIRLGENAEIYVNNNQNVRFNNCDIRNSCTKMWQGITAESNNAGIFFEGSNISLNRVEGVIRAVDLSNDANFEIAYTDFVNNFQNIRINNYAKTLRGRLHVVPANMQGYIYGCTFNSTPGSMSPPHSGQTSLDDIQLANVPHILLGYADNNTNNAHFTNTFAGADVGIRSTNSELQIVNSNFNNMRGANIFPKNNAAIRATSAYDCNDRTLTVGGNFANNVDRCTFVNSGFGIYTAGEMNVDVQNNIFGTAAVAGSGNTTGDIFISLPGLKNVNISSNNRFYQFNHAVQINTSPQYATNIFIDNNIFDTYTRPVSEDQYFGTAVLVINKGASVQKPKRNFSITNNTIINPALALQC